MISIQKTLIKATNRINGQAHGIWLDILETDKLWFPAKFVVGFVVKSKIAMYFIGIFNFDKNATDNTNETK